MMLPTNYRVTSKFGWRIHPITKEKSFHNGVDLAMPINTPIYAPLSGIARNFYDERGGNQLILRCFKDNVQYDFGFAHLSKIVIKANDRAEEGQLIAYSGNSGRSTSPHLHLTIKINGEYINPERFFNKKK